MFCPPRSLPMPGGSLPASAGAGNAFPPVAPAPPASGSSKASGNDPQHTTRLIPLHLCGVMKVPRMGSSMRRCHISLSNADRLVELSRQPHGPPALGTPGGRASKLQKPDPELQNPQAPSLTMSLVGGAFVFLEACHDKQGAARLSRFAPDLARLLHCKNTH